MKKAKTLIRDLDVFGKEINLNFDQKGNTYQTFVGGVMSILYYGFVLSVSAYGIVNIQDHSKDNYQ